MSMFWGWERLKIPRNEMKNVKGEMKKLHVIIIFIEIRERMAAFIYNDVI